MQQRSNQIFVIQSAYNLVKAQIKSTINNHQMELIENQWICPITQMPIKDPAITEDGHTYERAAIIQWFYTSSKSPKTGLNLQSKKLIPNRALKAVIEKFSSFMSQLYKNYKSDLSGLSQIVQNQINEKQMIIESLKQVLLRKYQEKQSLQLNSNNFSKCQDVKEIEYRPLICNSLKEEGKQLFWTKEIENIIIESQESLHKIIKSYSYLTVELLRTERQEQLRLKIQKIKKDLKNFSPSRKSNQSSLMQIQQNKKNSIVNSPLFLTFQQFIQTSVVPESLLNPFEYLLETFKNERQIKGRYRRNEFTDLVSLEHQRVPIDMSNFFKYDWKTLKSVNFMDCQITDKEWKIFVENSSYLPQLQQIKIYSNLITTIHNGDLETFKQLRSVLFYSKFNVIASLWGVDESSLRIKQSMLDKISIESSRDLCSVPRMKEFFFLNSQIAI